MTMESESGISDIDFYITDCVGGPVLGHRKYWLLPYRFKHVLDRVKSKLG